MPAIAHSFTFNLGRTLAELVILPSQVKLSNPGSTVPSTILTAVLTGQEAAWGRRVPLAASPCPHPLLNPRSRQSSDYGRKNE